MYARTRVALNNMTVFAISQFCIWVNLMIMLSTMFFGGFTIPWGP